MELNTLITSFLLALILSLLVILASSLGLRSRAKSKKKRRPPGPWGLPFVGSIHHLLTSQPQAALRGLAEKHGPVMYLRLGQVDTVVVSSAAAAQEVLRVNDLNFASRPSLLGAEIICYGNLDVAFAPYGAYWRALRKLCALELLSACKVRRFAPIRDSETMSLVREVLCRSGSSGGEPVNLGDLLVSCASSITGIAAFGDRCSGELMEQFLSAISVLISDISGFCVSDLFPSLRLVDVVTGTKRRLRRAHRQLDGVLDKIIAECEARRKERKAKNTGGEDDLLSVMLRIRDEGEFEFPFNTTNIKAIILDLFTGGTETVSSTAEWVMAELMKNPDAMAKAQTEVWHAFKNTSPCDHGSQMDELHYTRMVIKETLRLHPPLPLLLPRLCRETCDVGAFEVAKGSRVIVNSWAIARSPEYWDDAEEFKPERFENSTADYKGTQFEYLPFGHGRRICPGFGFGMASLELIVARLLYYLNWSLPDGMQPEELDMDTTVGASAKRTNQLHLVASPYEVRMEI
ncbi:9-beta-pimara-7,15-diene oxidase-like [Phragmites australis]|uniref:9-beta-pimara-7,15-diene oxidase-like n=1 Tax=Phragmites australis TaxID=29695 RepID=UPI002D79435F|nr:9-beta-pimara-7,15-diene oxidase-like [Phragmites australis]XP_062214907.1 9-beta-pimara-7,15-diene oxidase-like [Phragmites australis]XP_062214914.1 9-beta-pimara-7,15-diene oxidase-like [Phragmites australis]